jgi:signal transduction histidine kinase/PAS domain-containing protein
MKFGGAVAAKRASAKSAKKKSVAKKSRAKPVAAAKDPLFEALDSSPIGATISRVSDGAILYANTAVEAFFKISRGRSLGGLSTADFFTNPADRDQLVALVREQGGVTRYALPMRMSDGKPRNSLITNRLIKYRQEPAILTWIEDQSEAQRKEDSVEFTARQVELVNSIAAISNRAVNFYDALRQGAAEIGAFLGWPIRLVYRLSEGEAERLEIATFGLGKGLFADQSVKSAILGRSFGRGEDIPGRVLETGASVWIEDVSADPSLARFAGVQNIIASALAIPIKAGDKVVAVLEFLKQIPAAADDLLKLTFERVGSELGRVYTRDQITVALQQARTEAEASTRIKAGFLSAMSAEMRTPLHDVVGMLEQVLKTNLDTEQRAALLTAQASGHSFVRVIDDMLDYVRIDSGKLEIEIGDFSIADVIAGVVSSFQSAAAGKGLRLTADVDARIPARVRGDGVRVAQILSNLVSNAIKFSCEGEIAIAAQLMEGDRGEVRFSVKDQGVGISPQARRGLFQEFSRGATADSTAPDGKGLGLALSQRLIAMMGGEIGVESVLGEGSIFHFTLPIAVASGSQ